MVTISDCLLSGGYEEGALLDGTFKLFPTDAKVPRTGRIKFGTESNGGFKNITVSNCVFEGCNGLAIESVDGAIIEDVCVSNLTMRNLVGAPIFLRLGARMRGPAGVPVGAIRRVTLSNIVCMNAPSPKICSIVTGIPGHSIEDLKLSDITILHQGGGTAADAASSLAEKEKDYPEPNMFGATPAQGFFLRHVSGVEMSGIKIQAAQDDVRPAFALHDVRRADFRFIKVPAGNSPALVLNDVKDFTIAGSKPVPNTELESADRKQLP
jgi:polygalacturonase